MTYYINYFNQLVFFLHKYVEFVINLIDDSKLNIIFYN